MTLCAKPCAVNVDCSMAGSRLSPSEPSKLQHERVNNNQMQIFKVETYPGEDQSIEDNAAHINRQS